MANVTETPRKVSLPPLSKILCSPAETSLRHSLIQSTPMSQKVSNIFTLPFPSGSSSSISTSASSLSHNIFNPLPSNTRTHSLPSIDNLTSSPSLQKSLSYSNQLPIPTSSHAHTYIPVTPLSYKKSSLLPIFNNQSTPNKPFTAPTLPIIKNKITSLISNENTTNISVNSESNDSFTHSTPFKSRSSANTSITSPEMKGSLSTSVTKTLDFSSEISTINIKNNGTSSTINKKKRKSSFDDSKSFAFISHSQETFLSNEPDIDNARLARRKRRRTSPTELAILQNEFKKGTTPNKQRRIQIANRVDMTEKAVQIWFQNKRQAMRKVQNQNSKEFIIEVNNDDYSVNNAILDADESNENDDENDDDDDDDDEIIDNHNLIQDDANESNSSNSSNSSELVENKENINPLSDKLPPTGTFSPNSNLSKISILKFNKKIPLTDITNNINTTGNAGQTFKFKSTNFGLIAHNSNNSRRQKPTMKLKIKLNGTNITNSNNSTNIINKAINNTINNITSHSDFHNSVVFKKQNLVVFNDATGI